MRRMADSTNAANLPTGWDLYAGYIDGRFQSYGPAPLLVSAQRSACPLLFSRQPTTASLATVRTAT